MSSEARHLPSSWWCILMLTPPPPNTHTCKHRHTVPTIPERAAFVWRQGDPVAWGLVKKYNRGLSSCTHPAGCVGPAVGKGCDVRGITTPFHCGFKTPIQEAPWDGAFHTARADGAKSLLVTQSHAVNRWSGYWVKERASGGGSPSIPAGNNRAAGQECCLQEEGSGRRCMLWHSQAMWTLWNSTNWEDLLGMSCARGGGSWRTSWPLSGDQNGGEGGMWDSRVCV